MSELITSRYRELNREMHDKGNYGISGWKWAPAVHDLATQWECNTVLDYGAGRGTLKYALEKFCAPLSYKVLEFDPAVTGKEDKPQRADLVVCGDVMEHVEPECINNVLDDIYNIALDGVFFVIATRPAVKTLPDGRNAHLVVEPDSWWLPKLEQRWRCERYQDRNGEFLWIGGIK